MQQYHQIRRLWRAVTAVTLVTGGIALAAPMTRPARAAMIAAQVYGQPDFTTNTANRVTAGSLNLPQGTALDASGGLYVVDSHDNRVLYYPSGSTTATRVYGQSGFTSYTANSGGVGASTLNDPQGVAVDPTSGGGIYIADTNNHRILHYPSTCTVNACAADRVYGQPNFTSSSIRTSSIFYPNSVAADSSGGIYVASQSANRVLHIPSGNTTADRAYGQPDLTSTTANNGGVSASSLHGPEGVAVDGSGGLYVADAFNNRVLHYPSTCATSGCAADRVYGQSGFTSTGSSASSTGLNISTGNPVGLAPDASGGLYIADTNNNRVLHFPGGCVATGCAADVVYGQPDFTSTSAGASATGLAGPYGAALDSSGNLYIADGGNNRVLSYLPGSTTAIQVYGQPDFTSTGTGAVGANTLSGALATVAGTALDGSGGFYLADTGNNRVLHYPAGSTTADRVYGQPTFTASVANNGGISATSLNGPTGVALDGSGGLYVADSRNNRVLHYPAGSTTADRVYGQPDFTSNGYSSSIASATSLWQPEGLALDSSGLYVADAQNDRVLHYPADSTTADRAYGQPDLNTGFATNQGCYQPADITTALCLPQGLAADGTGGLYVTDPSHNRVLYYATGSTSPARVYGQPNFTSTSSGLSATSLNLPLAAALDGNGDLYVADALNNRVLYFPAGSTVATRIYGQASLTSYYGAQAGAGTFYRPSGVIVDGSGDFYVADSGNNRALYFPSATVTGMFYPGLGLAHPVLSVPPARYHFGLWDRASNTQGPNAALLDFSAGTAQQASMSLTLDPAGDSPVRVLNGEFLGPSMATQILAPGSWTVGLGVRVDLLAGDNPSFTGYAAIYLINGATGQIRSEIGEGWLGAYRATVGQEVTVYGTVNGASLTVQAGDYLDVELGVQSQSSSSSGSATLYAGGTTAITADGVATTDASSFVQAPGTLTFQ